MTVRHKYVFNDPSERADPPQAVTDGALTEAGPLSKEDLLALDGLEKTHPNLWRHFRECGQAVLELQQRLAAHDQKVRAETLEEAAKVADQYPTYRRDDQSKGSAAADAIRSLAAPALAPAASKPEAGNRTARSVEAMREQASTKLAERKEPTK